MWDLFLCWEVKRITANQSVIFWVDLCHWKQAYPQSPWLTNTFSLSLSLHTLLFFPSLLLNDVHIFLAQERSKHDWIWNCPVIESNFPFSETFHSVANFSSPAQTFCVCCEQGSNNNHKSHELWRGWSSTAQTYCTAGINDERTHTFSSRIIIKMSHFNNNDISYTHHSSFLYTKWNNFLFNIYLHNCCPPIWLNKQRSKSVDIQSNRTGTFHCLLHSACVLVMGIFQFFLFISSLCFLSLDFINMPVGGDKWRITHCWPTVQNHWFSKSLIRSRMNQVTGCIWNRFLI